MTLYLWGGIIVKLSISECALNGTLLLKRTKKINNCIANSKKFFIGNNKDEYERQKKFILVVKLIWLIKQKTLKAILRLLNAKRISRVKIIEFSVYKSKDE